MYWLFTLLPNPTCSDKVIRLCRIVPLERYGQSYRSTRDPVSQYFEGRVTERGRRWQVGVQILKVDARKGVSGPWTHTGHQRNILPYSKKSYKSNLYKYIDIFSTKYDKSFTFYH